MLSTFLMYGEVQVKKILVQNLFIHMFVMWVALKQLLFSHLYNERTSSDSGIYFDRAKMLSFELKALFCMFIETS